MAIQANFIIEMLGRPAEHLKKSMQDFVENLGKERDVIVRGSKVHEPKPVEQNKGLFSTFAEIGIEVENLTRLIELVFIYMPSSIEIFEPQEIKLKINDANIIINSLAARLHRYDAIAKTLSFEKTILENQLRAQGQKPALPKISIAGKKVKEEKKKAKKKAVKKVKKKR